MQDYIEYEFTLADGTKRYEMIDRQDVPRQVNRFVKYHNATLAKPVKE